MQRERMGVVTGGAFNEGLMVRLDEEASSEAMQIGDFCVIEGDKNLYFSMIQDLRLEATDARLMAAPPPYLSPFMRRALRGTSTYVVAEVKPMLMVKRLDDGMLPNPDEEGGPRPVRTIPMHFAQLVQASAADFATVFGQDSGRGDHFAMGQPLTMEMDIPVNLRRLVERSSGIFGSTGTGKSFLTRILLCGVIARRAAVNLIFDMHNEYAYGKESEEGERVKGLKELFGPQVVVYTLDKTNRRADHDLAIGLDEIETGDVLSLSRELGLPSSTADVNLSMLHRRFRKQWLREFINLAPDELAALAEEMGGHLGSLQALARRLQRLRDRDYIHEHVSKDVFGEMMHYLDMGRHIILHFGRHDDVLDQMIVANMVTRRIRELYREKTETYQLSGKKGDKPQPLVITVEEAHRFLNPEMARQTIFGTIARELRKYYVTLLIVDQRPSGIDDEILSQVGTRISGKLLDERDLEAVLSGVANRAAIRAGLASLDTKQQVLIFGHALPMPIALRTRRYDSDFYGSVTGTGSAPNKDVLDLYGPDEPKPRLSIVAPSAPPPPTPSRKISTCFLVSRGTMFKDTGYRLPVAGSQARRLSTMLLVVAMLLLAACQRGTATSSSPIVTITAPNNGASVPTGQMVEIQSVAVDNVSPIQRVEMYINGDLIADDSTPNAAGESSFMVTQRWVPVEPGDARIEVYAYNMANERSQAATLTLQVQGPGLTSQEPSAATPTSALVPPPTAPTEVQPTATPEPPAGIPGQVTADIGLNVRSSPGTSSERIGGVNVTEQVTAIARNAAGDWVKIRFGADNREGWVAAAYISWQGDIQTLPVE